MRSCQMQNNFRCSDDLCKLGKEYVNSLTCKFYFFLDKIRKLLTYSRTPRLSTANRHKVINSEKSPVYFGLACRRLIFKLHSYSINDITIIDGFRERSEYIDIFLFLPITQSCSVSDVLFTGGRGVSDFSVLKYY